MPRHFARLTYFLHPKLREINAVLNTPQLISLPLQRLQRAGSVPTPIPTALPCLTPTPTLTCAVPGALCAARQTQTAQCVGVCGKCDSTGQRQGPTPPRMDHVMHVSSAAGVLGRTHVRARGVRAPYHNGPGISCFTRISPAGHSADVLERRPCAQPVVPVLLPPLPTP